MCLAATGLPFQDLIQECPMCGHFFAYCCKCTRRSARDSQYEETPQPCDHTRIIFTDGACTNNGEPTAKSGIGIAYSSDTEGQLSISIDKVLVDFPAGSNQRAELIAVTLGLDCGDRFRTSQGKKPANLDLFLRFDALVTELEAKITKFCYVPRKHNHLADRLAKTAAVDGTVAMTLDF
ncbi:hypothetical protein PSV08DRAFT_372291 [Bipolaris maydis]|uniref:uncharacterized protein n=1 Tax=Cochliobolus heterostrophus TaxID=5016 RepID=UPI0024CEB939|nr:hypothetical protein J3E73DRAFT_394677 [Bipolaris maydis]KAJ5025755.1 hypothetical protein J3E73DRAFT_391934 [Bipolaris maydis]KAJ6269968.1 hypothetical protein PSV08DRAFT_372291 [Bipolaris maydis]